MKQKMIKYLIWRIIGGLGTGLITWTVLFDQDLEYGLVAAYAGTAVLVDIVVKHVCYVLHEAVWRKFGHKE